MGRLFAAIYDPFMRSSEVACLEDWRRALIAPITRGRVLEIGAGTGVNLKHYSASLDELVLTDPDEHMLARLSQRLSDAKITPQIVVAEAHALPFADASFDAVVCTLVLCSVPDVAATLAEVKRLLKSDGKLVFLEHVAAVENPSRHRWQRRLEPIWRPLAGNCHLTRKTGEAIEMAGFTFESMTRESMRKSNPLARTTIRGHARPT